MKAIALVLLLCLGSVNATGERSKPEVHKFLSAAAAHKAFVFQQTDLPKKIQSTIERLFGGDVQPATDHKPYFFTGDFNGDARADLLVLVRVNNSGGNLAREVRRLNPWGYNKTQPSALALAIVHGSAAGWDTETPLARFIVGDKDFFSTPIWTGTSDTPMSLKKKRLTKGQRSGLPRLAKGDAVALGTEAGIDILLYWDGKTYRIFEPNEEP